VRGPPDHNENPLDKEKNMTDPESTDADAPIRTWERMTLPERDRDGGRPDRDPFGFFSNENGDSDD
jgi:hypothetical protein